ncbi:MAG: hypothetical protein SA339_14225, partial [Methanomassiliicoccus sp.]|nr:hypothetical protein [Methanomassiliicoccus sp.]
QGKMYQNFGPLNKAGGERRLNVAITRARKHVKLVASIRAEDIEGTTPGAEALREYIAYAMTHELGADAHVSEESSDHLQAEIRAWLESRGLVVEEHVGRSVAKIDLAVADRNRPGNYVLGILTDGASYHKAGNARDRERLRTEILTGLGWSIHRVWSQEWIKDRDREGERILAALDRARAAAAERALREQEGAAPVIEADMPDTAVVQIGPMADLPSAASPAAPETAVASLCETSLSAGEATLPSLGTSESAPDQATVLPSATQEGAASKPKAVEAGTCLTYCRVDLVSIPSLVESYRSDPSRTLIEAAEIVVRTEGPVHQSVVKDRIRDLVAASTGKRPGNLDKVIKQTAASLERYGKVKVDGEFLWPTDRTELSARRCEDHRRNVDHVCDQEMEAMVLSLVPTDRPVNLRDLANGVSALLGYKRPTPSIRSRVERAVDALSSKEAVVSEEEHEAKCEPSKDDDGPATEQACP